MKKILAVIVISVILFSCNSDDTDFLFDSEKVIIEQYLENNNLEIKNTDSGLYYIIHEEGAGEILANDFCVNFNDSISGIDGTLFREQNNEIYLCSRFLSPMFYEGFKLIKEGGSITVYSPSSLAYGKEGNALLGIAPNTIIVLYLELIKVEQ